MDFISFSPSLLDILSLLELKDVQCCTLLNRRINALIKRSRRTLAKALAEISIEFCLDEEVSDEGNKILDGVTVSLFTARRERRFRVATSNILILGSESQWIVDFYEQKGAARVKLESDYRYHVGSIVWDVSFRTGSIEEGLKELLALIFERFHFEIVELTSLHEYASDELCVLIGNLMKNCSSKCDQLKLGTCYPEQWNDVINKFDCTSVFFKASLEHLNKYLPKIEVWNSHLIFEIDRALSRECLGYVVKIIEKWQSGSISRIRYLQIAPNARVPHVLTVKNVVNAVKSTSSRVQYMPQLSNSPTVSISFKRNDDEIILSLKYEQVENRLEIFEPNNN